MDKNNIAIILRQEPDVPKAVLDREFIIVITNKDMMSSNREDIQIAKS